MILEKPFWENWKDKEFEIVKRVENYYLNEDIKVNPSKISIKSGNTSWIVQFSDLVYVEVPFELKGKGKLILHTIYKSFDISSSLNNFERELPDFFIRINRFTIINSNFISHFDHSEQCAYLRNYPDKCFNVGDKFRNDLLRILEI